MKKKGLIVATIVMVLVLAVSLTTATYAWFTASSVTSIEGFSVEISANNAVNIGMRKANSFLTGAGLTTAGFYTGEVTFTAAGAGQFGGTWGGENAVEGLSASLSHDINWGPQSKAIGFATSALSIEDDPQEDDYQKTAKSNLTAISASSTRIYAANNDPKDAEGLTLANVTLANANKDGSNEGDYVWLFLGASPTRALSINNLVIMCDMSQSTSSTIGIMSALHIAYRTSINGATASAWNDVQIFGADIHQSAQKSTLNKNKFKGANVAYNTTSEADAITAIESAYVSTYGGTYPTASSAYVITGLSTTANYIDQIEILIYIDGNDADAIDAALGSKGAIKIFFQTADA